MSWINNFGLNNAINPVLNSQISPVPQSNHEESNQQETVDLTPGIFSGLTEAAKKTLPGAWYQSLSSYHDLIAQKIENFNYGLGEQEDAFAPELPKNAQEEAARLERQEAKFARLKVKNDYTPNPETTGFAGQMLYGLGGTVAKAIGYTALTGSPLLAGLPMAVDTGVYESGRLQDQGVDSSTANKAGLISGLSMGAGIALPASLGSKVIRSMLFGAGSNVALDTGEQCAVQFVLKNANYDKIAGEYDPFNPVNLGISAGAGALFGVMGARSSHYIARKARAEQERIAQEGSENVFAVSKEVLDTATLQAIQNRDRGNKESIAQMLAISKNPDFNRLRESTLLGEGSPVVAYGGLPGKGLLGNGVEVSASDGRRMKMHYAVLEADNILTSNTANGATINSYANAAVPGTRAIAGNGRIAGVKAAYERGTASKYRSELIENVEKFGISKRLVKKMEKPILVRFMRNEDVTADIGELSNRSGIQKLSPSEQAKQDARNVKLEDVEFNVDGSISRKSMDDFVMKTPDKEGLVDGQGDIVYDNVQARMRPAIFASAFNDTHLINRFITNNEQDRRLLNTLMSVAPVLVRLRNIGGDLDFSEAVVQAVADIFQIRKETKSIKKGEKTVSLFGATPEQEFFKQVLLTPNPERLLEIMQRLHEIAANESEGAGLGFVDKVSRQEVFDTVRKEFAEFDEVVASISKSQIDAAMELRSAEVIQNDQPVGEEGNLWRSLKDEATAREQLDNGEPVRVDGNGVDGKVFDAQVEKFTADVTRQLIGAGMEEKVALLEAKVQESFFRTLAERTGESFDSLVKKYGVRVESRQDKRQQGGFNQDANSIPPIAEAPDFELITVAKDKDGTEHRVLGVNGNPDLAMMPEGVEGIKPLPVRLQEETVKRGHLQKHLKELKKAGYESVEQAVWDISRNYDAIYEGSQEGGLVLARELPSVNKARGVLLVKLQDIAGCYRVGSVLATEKPAYLQNRKKLLWGKTPSIRLQQNNPLRTREFTGPEDASDDSILSNIEKESNTLKTGGSSGELFQTEGERQIKSIADIKLETEAKRWAQTLDNLKHKPKQPILVLEQTPLVMTMVGAKFRELKAAPHLFDGIFPHEKTNPAHHSHLEMTRDILKQIPEALADPIAVLKDAHQPNTFVFMLDLKDASGNTVVAPVKFSAAGPTAEINLVKTAFGKENSKYFRAQEQQNRLIYINRKKMTRWNQQPGTNPLRGSNESGVSVLTEADLVKRRSQENNTLYQTAYHGSPHIFSRRGAYSPAQRIITLFNTTDESTFLHESGHHFLETTFDIAAREDAPLQLKQDSQTIMQWFGVEDMNTWNRMSLEEKRPYHEQFARGFEQYLREGIAPSQRLKEIFETFKNWLTSLYRSAEELHVELTPEIRDVYARMLATDAERQAMAMAEAEPGHFAATRNIADNVVDFLPLPERSKELLREGLNRLTGGNDSTPSGGNHPRNIIMNEDQSIEMQARADLERDPMIEIVDSEGNSILGAEFIERAEMEARTLERDARGMSEAALCMYRQGAFD